MLFLKLFPATFYVKEGVLHTRGYLDELINEESYQSARVGLVNQKTTLKQEKQHLHKTGSGF